MRPPWPWAELTEDDAPRRVVEVHSHERVAELLEAGCKPSLFLIFSQRRVPARVIRLKSAI